MGLKNGTKAFWTAKNALYQDLVVIHKQIFKKSLPIRVDVDISVIFHPVLRDRKYGYSDILNEICDELIGMASCGFVVTPVLDGIERPDCNRYSWKRRTRKLLCQANSIFCKEKAMAVGDIIDNGEGTKELNEILKSVRKEASSLEKQGVIRVVKSTLMDDLSDKLFQSEAYKKRDMNGGFVEQPIRNAFQVDTMMAYRVMKGDTGMIYSNDSDFGMCLGPDFYFIKLMVRNSSPLVWWYERHHVPRDYWHSTTARTVLKRRPD